MTEEEINLTLEMAEDSMQQAIKHLDHEFLKIRTGKAAATMLDGIMIDYYGAQTPISQVANIVPADARTLTVQPWERKVLNAIEKAIFEANMGITPQNDGSIIRLSIPPLTEERRRDMVKKAKAAADYSKVGVRNARKDAMDSIKKAVKDGFSEDAGKRKEEEIQKLTDRFTEKIDKLMEAKEKDIMTI